ncbi:MAG: YaiI/YqxD family protein [Deltaproteobacteria bacterium]|nr:YaiI/YqxD family protein [Deltaproteobacteria bacterium]
MKIWVDADACPRDVKELVFRAAERLQIPAVLVANSDLNVPRSAFVSSVRVGKGLDVADGYLVQHAEPGDLAITADIPLAAALVAKGVPALDPRGDRYDEDNVRERLAVRDLMKDLRDSGVATGGPRSFDSRDKQSFANALDRELSRLKR